MNELSALELARDDFQVFGTSMVHCELFEMAEQLDKEIRNINILIEHIPLQSPIGEFLSRYAR